MYVWSCDHQRQLMSTWPVGVVADGDEFLARSAPHVVIAKIPSLILWTSTSTTFYLLPFCRNSVIPASVDRSVLTGPHTAFGFVCKVLALGRSVLTIT